jgi:hypothetical protein
MSQKFEAKDMKRGEDFSRAMHSFIGPPYKNGWLKASGLVPQSVAAFAFKFIQQIHANAWQVDDMVSRTVTALPALRRKTGRILNEKPYDVGVWSQA